ncbi:hypothetical protein MMC21_004420 [Puttea exsequens]|nr:hypothetical protein [Puttea exsequens]
MPRNFFSRKQVVEDDDDDDEQQQVPRGQASDEDDDENRRHVSQTQASDADDDDDDNQRGQQADDDDDQDNSSNVRHGQQLDEDEDQDDTSNVRHGQQDEDDEDDVQKAGRTENDSEDEDRHYRQQSHDDDASPPPSPAPQKDDDEDDGQSPAATGTQNINLNINLNLDHSDLHDGGTLFSKKLLAQLFSGPGDHDPHEQELGAHEVEHEHVEKSEDEEWTIVELKAEDATGGTIYLKAKLDSGADDNFMSFDIYQVTGLDFTPYEGPEGPPSFTTGGGEETEPIGTVKLAYTAGVKPQRFVETFQVLEGLPHDVIIGKPLMTNAHMIMVNPNFAHPPEHKRLCLLELPKKDSDSKAKALAFQKQRAAEQRAAYEAKIRAQEGAAPKARKKGLFGRH